MFFVPLSQQNTTKNDPPTTTPYKPPKNPQILLSLLFKNTRKGIIHTALGVY